MLLKHWFTANTPHQQLALQRQTAATDRQIDRLVYVLYGLTEEEIRVVEGTRGGKNEQAEAAEEGLVRLPKHPVR